MPEMDGFALIEQIRQLPDLTSPTIMMLSSSGHRGDAARCEELEVAAYLLKPIRQSELRQTLSQSPAAIRIAGYASAAMRRLPALHNAQRHPGDRMNSPS